MPELATIECPVSRITPESSRLVEIWHRWKTAGLSPTEKTESRLVEAFGVLDGERAYVETIERTTADEWRKLK